MNAAPSRPEEKFALSSALKYAWLCYGIAFVGLFLVLSFCGREAMLLAFFLLVACSFWLAFVTGRAASSCGHTGLLWGAGVFLLGSFGCTSASLGGAEQVASAQLMANRPFDADTRVLACVGHLQR